MQDELLMRDWSAFHEDFTAGLPGGRGKPAGRGRTDGLSFDMIEPAYRPQRAPAPRGVPSSQLSRAARASVSGFAASVITALLWTTLVTLAQPAPEAAPDATLSSEASATVSVPPLA